MKRFWSGFSTLLFLAVVLAVWVALPWAGILVLTALLGLWLALTRTGQVALEATRVGVATLPQRWGASSVIIIGIAGVVGVLVAMLAMGEGFQATMDAAGSEETAIVLRGGSQAESNSVILRDQVPVLANLPGVQTDADGRPLISAEVSQVVALPSMSDGSDANVQFRGIGPEAVKVRGNVRFTEGRAPGAGLREIAVGRGAQGQFRGLDMGNTLTLANQRWTVVGVFETGDAYESELWGDAQTVATTYNRPAYQSVLARTGTDGFEAFKAAVEGDPRLKLEAMTTRDYFAQQSGGLKTLLTVLGTVIGGIMAVGAVFGALNTMYAAVAARAREIATLRAIGFHGLPVVTGVMLETMLLALLGGLLGGLIAWLMFNNFSASTLGSNFSQVVFRFRVTPELLATGLKWALGIGLMGGLFPALRAARLPIATALREG